jgi:hypothetical protein
VQIVCAEHAGSRNLFRPRRRDKTNQQGPFFDAGVDDPQVLREVRGPFSRVSSDTTAKPDEPKRDEGVRGERDRKSPWSKV